MLDSIAVPSNFLTDPFFPIVTRSGVRRWVAFPDLAALAGDYPVEFDWPRGDLNTACLELAIGVATLALQPRRTSDWIRLWNEPPSPGFLQAALAPYVHAFVLDGDGPRFLQELGGVEGEAAPIEALLIDTPGANGQKKNADVLTHRGRYEALGLPAAAIALYALQQFAPSGGAGNRTSMRGGGPLTTLVIPAPLDGAPPPLWRIVLANLVENASNEIDPEDLPRILPWLAPTIVSDKAHSERMIHQKDEDALAPQAFFGMPRRLSLQFGGEGICAMTGERGPLVTGFVQKPWGANYGQWLHPLTPYRRLKEDSEWFSIKPKSARFGYRDWVAATVSDKGEKLRVPAPNVRAGRGERAMLLRSGAESDARLRAAGWAMNNMEAVAYLLAEQPFHLAGEPARQEALDQSALRFARASDIVANALRLALRIALFAEVTKPSTDSGVFDEARLQFYESTENAFHETLADLIDEAVGAPPQAKRWLATMAHAAEAAFEHAVPAPIGDAERGKRVASGFRLLRLALFGHGKFGEELFEALHLPAPEKKQAGKGRKRP